MHIDDQKLPAEEKLKKIDGFSGHAPKVSGSGHIAYELWIDNNGLLFTRFLENQTNTDTPGTCSRIFYPVAKYSDKRNSQNIIDNLAGIDEQGNTVSCSNNNDNAFLKAVLRNLLPTET